MTRRRVVFPDPAIWTRPKETPMPDDRATPTPLPILDSDRATAPAESGRHICDVLPPVQPYVPEIDNRVTMPVRLAYSMTAGWCLEVGPYDLDAADILALRQAIAAWDDATGEQ